MFVLFCYFIALYLDCAEGGGRGHTETTTSPFSSQLLTQVYMQQGQNASHVLLNEIHCLKSMSAYPNGTKKSNKNTSWAKEAPERPKVLQQHRQKEQREQRIGNHSHIAAQKRHTDHNETGNFEVIHMNEVQ